ncbi:MAG TPA: acetate--CoA ligase family protein [Acidimicrobiales bacterium]|nr:acetate--CoA ligase family protein [Acidimicrobiales bacterium]
MPQQRTDLEEFFHPEAVALVGSVNRNAKPERLTASYDERWGSGRWYLVNAKGGQIGDITVYEHVTDIPTEITLAVVNVGTRLVARTVEECGKHGVPYVLIFSAGFSEVGEAGAALEREVGDMARRYGIRVFGPNTNTNAFETLPEPPKRRGGRIGLVTQSGHQGRPLVQGTEFGVAFSRWVPTGNELDLEAADFIEYYAYDDDTDVISGYFEGFKDPAKLRRSLEAANAQRKPVVALKMGATAAGARMASSHTGHLAGSDAVVDGLFRQYGVVRVHDLDELLETSALFAKLPAGTGPNCCLYSISGGSGTLMAEVAESSGVPVPILSAKTQAALREMIPDYLTVANPVDNGAQFLVSAPVEDRRRVFEVVAADENVDVIVVGLTGALGRLTDRFAEDIVSFIDDLPKPVVVTWNSFKTDEAGFRTLVDAGVPMFRSFRNCFTALRSFAGHEEQAATFRARKALSTKVPAEARPVLDDAASRPGGPLGTDEARRLLEAFDVPLAGEGLATSAAEAARLAGDIGFPVVMKIASPDFPHKSDAGLVRLGVASASEARAVYGELVDRAHKAKARARIEGVQIQQQVEGGTEMIVGVTRDPVFGPAVLVGTGGVFAEVLADATVRPLPLDRRDAQDMVTSLRGYQLLRGARGRAKGDVKALVDVIMAVARLASACGEQLLELDLNPVVVQSDGAVAVDSLVVMAGQG